MSLRELWDTVVLRDILGYIVPGAVTLLAAAVFFAKLAGVDLWDTAAQCLSEGVTTLPAALGGYAPLLVPTAVVLSYVTGHLQAWLIEYLEEGFSGWQNGKLALAFLSQECMGEDYARAGLRLSKPTRTTSFADEPLMQHLREAKKPKDAVRQAKEVWRLCDRYVLHKDRDTHSMFMGRYYVLALLFTNLGISAMLLGAVTLAVQMEDCSLVLLSWLPVLVGLGALAAVLVAICCPCSIKALAAAVVCALVALSITGRSLLWFMTCLAPRIPCAAGAVLAVVSGVLMLARSGHFRKRFVECTFPIFYAIVQAEER